MSRGYFDLKLRKAYLLIFIGLSIILLLLTFSYISVQSESEPIYYTKDEMGALKSPPFAPSTEYPLGSDREGRSLLNQIITGAKFTIGLSLFIAFARIIVSLILAVILMKLPSFFKNTLHSIADAFHYAPLSLFVFILVSPVILAFSWSYDDVTKLYFPVFILIILALPILTVYIVNEIETIYMNDFIVSSKVMGGGFGHIMFRHIRLFLTPKLLLLFMQQVGQTLLIFAHLGLLKIFIGGTESKVISEGLEGEQQVESFSMSYEWGGMIAKNFQYINTYPWMVLAPVIAFSITILAIQLTIEGFKQRESFRNI